MNNYPFVKNIYKDNAQSNKTYHASSTRSAGNDGDNKGSSEKKSLLVLSSYHNDSERSNSHHQKYVSIQAEQSFLAKRGLMMFFLQMAMVLLLAGIGLRSLLSTTPTTTVDNGNNPMMNNLASSSLPPYNTQTTLNSANANYKTADGVYPCREGFPCFYPSKIRVQSLASGMGGDTTGATTVRFPSFWDYAHQGPIQVGYNRRSVTINGDGVFLLGGSLHPSRATQETWNSALDEAVHNGLNLITIYVMWSAHQPRPHMDFDWSFPGALNVACHAKSTEENNENDDEDENNDNDQICDWNLASAIRAAANRGLLVHIRIGPYDCAEYNYGGIPEWLALDKPHMVMRRPNREWLDVMKTFVEEMVSYLTDQQLWAHQGGNIILAQIENELGDDEATKVDISEILLVDPQTGVFVDRNNAMAAQKSHNLRNATLQDYADWCGALAQEVAPQVTWTMCNGLSAPNTILTCNAINDAPTWLEHNGGNGRIQIDQPAMLTEFEGGFQVWGELPDKPLDYFWGRTAREMSRDALRWWARGGTHLNYYMWWGGYNRGRSAGAGITNIYASDVALCPSGQRRQPKFGHLQALHEVMRGIAPTLVKAHSALHKSQPIPYMAPDGTWQTGEDQRMFEYSVVDQRGKLATGFPHVIFVENDATEKVPVRIPLHTYNDGRNTPPLTKEITLSPSSSVLLVDGIVEFDSASIDPRSMSFQREYADKSVTPLRLLDWSAWQEPLGAPSDDRMTITSACPVEQTALNVKAGVDSDYAWYETTFDLEDDVTDDAILFIETQMANAFVAFIDHHAVGAADNHLHKEGNITLSIHVGAISKGHHKLRLLSESLGYHNLIGRWGGSTTAKTKGVTGDVLLSIVDKASTLDQSRKNISLIDGRDWRSYPGLHGESSSSSATDSTSSVRPDNLGRKLREDHSSALSLPRWASALFDTPRYDSTFQQLFIKITEGRGHVWLNGRDLGRYWNITRGENSTIPSQQYYALPDDFVYGDGNLNELILFDAFGSAGSDDSVELIMSWIAQSHQPTFLDEVDYADECI